MTYLVPQKSSMQTTYNSSVYTVAYFNEIISTDATDNAQTEWDDTTTFARDDYVKVTDLKRIYRCASDNSTNQYPPANPTVWVDYGATNSYKLFDDIIGSQTEFDTNMTIEISANRMNMIAFLNMDNVSSISITQTNLRSDTTFDRVIDLVDYGVLSLYDYWYKPLSYRRDLVIKDLQFLVDAKLTITFNANGIGKVGAVVSGLADNLGLTLFGSKVKLKDYSNYTTDSYGNTSFRKRGCARIITGQVIIDTNLVDETITKVASRRGDLTLYVGDEREDGFGSLSTLGYIETLELEPTPSKTKYPITIIGVI